jgi:hypothetical protein
MRTRAQRRRMKPTRLVPSITDPTGVTVAAEARPLAVVAPTADGAQVGELKRQVRSLPPRHDVVHVERYTRRPALRALVAVPLLGCGPCLLPRRRVVERVGHVVSRGGGRQRSTGRGMPRAGAGGLWGVRRARRRRPARVKRERRTLPSQRGIRTTRRSGRSAGARPGCGCGRRRGGRRR